MDSTTPLYSLILKESVKVGFPIQVLLQGVFSSTTTKHTIKINIQSSKIIMIIIKPLQRASSEGYLEFHLSYHKTNKIKKKNDIWVQDGRVQLITIILYYFLFLITHWYVIGRSNSIHRWITDSLQLLKHSSLRRSNVSSAISAFLPRASLAKKIRESLVLCFVSFTECFILFMSGRFFGRIFFKYWKLLYIIL